MHRCGRAGGYIPEVLSVDESRQRVEQTHRMSMILGGQSLTPYLPNTDALDPVPARMTLKTNQTSRVPISNTTPWLLR